MTPNPDHLERTAAEPRDKSLNTVVIQHIEEINETARVFRLEIPQSNPPIRFLPGQWLDVYVPGVEKAGGFTITSTPREARLPHRAAPSGESAAPAIATATGGSDSPRGPHLELAVQKSPESLPAAWLWQSPATVLGSPLRVRVGGGFVFPPPGINVRALRRVVFVAGGMGVNPLVSMLLSMASTAPAPGAGAGGGLEVHFLYSLRDPGAGGGERRRREARNMLFLERISRVFRQGKVRGSLEVFLTGGGSGGEGQEGTEDERVIHCRDGGNEGGDGDEYTIPFHARRCTVDDDIAKALGKPADRRFAVVYVCGVPTMTDQFVARLTDHQSGLGLEPHRVLCEKWW